jgi:glycosyltransferase involved in cell wall biosynthesis
VLVISIVMPAHNEAELLPASVADVVEGLRARGAEFEVLVVENGSSDDTYALAEQLCGRFDELRAETLPKADYGAALRRGLLTAGGDAVVNFDVDYYDLDFLTNAVSLVRDVKHPPAIVVGSKRAPGADDQRSRPRRFVTWAFSTLLHALFGLEVSDTHGMKAMRRDAVLPLAQACRFDADLFDTELVIRAERADLVVTEIPVRVAERRPSRTSIVRRATRSLWGLARLRIVLWREGGAR